MTINEALDKFGDLIDNPESSLEDLSQIVNELFVKDNIIYGITILWSCVKI